MTEKEQGVVLNVHFIAWENSQHFVMPPLVSQRDRMSEKQAQKFNTNDVSLLSSGWSFVLSENLLQAIRRSTQI